jgi:hypothetical protein
VTTTGEAAPPPTWADADAAALREALAAAGPSKLPDAGWGDYLADLGTFLRDLIFETAGRAMPFDGWLAAEQLALYGALALAIAAAAFVLVVALRQRARRRRIATPVEAAPAAAARAGGDAEWWAAEAARRLAAGQLRGALEALWWWAARRLDPPGLDPAWTTAELLRASGRPALREPLRRLERLQWGDGEPRRDDVEGVAGRLREALE